LRPVLSTFVSTNRQGCAERRVKNQSSGDPPRRCFPTRSSP
jgi:hypothetical protein